MVDSAKVTELLAEAAESIILPRFGNLSDDQIRTKSSPTDLVTEVDVETEAFLKSALEKIAPAASFIGEEAAAADPSIVAAIEGEGRYWILDPLDGTRNFVRGVDEFATILALVENGVAVMGWIYAPILKAAAVVERGGGVTWNGAPVETRPYAGPKPTSLRSIGWLTGDWKDVLPPRLKASTIAQSSHCSAFAYLNLLWGDVDLKLSSRIHPWDHVAGALMLQEAGGRAAFLSDASAVVDYAPSDSVDRPLLATAPGRDFSAIAAALLD